MKKYTKEKLLKMDVIEVYKMILDGEIKAFPQGCWEQENAKENAAKCTKFLSQFPATYYHPKVIVEVGACNSTTRSFRLPFSLLPQTWATIGSMT